MMNTFIMFGAHNPIYSELRPQLFTHTENKLCRLFHESMRLDSSFQLVGLTYTFEKNASIFFEKRDIFFIFIFYGDPWTPL